jgi:hypothetical protein
MPPTAARRQQSSEPREPSRSTDGSNNRRDRRGSTVSWYVKLLIVSVLLIGAAWEVFKWILAIITLD